MGMERRNQNGWVVSEHSEIKSRREQFDLVLWDARNGQPINDEINGEARVPRCDHEKREERGSASRREGVGITAATFLA